MKRLIILSLLVLISASIVFSVNHAVMSINQMENESIIIDLRYKSGSIFDSDDDGVETVAGVIDFTVENSIFNWRVDETKLCTRWEIYKEGSNVSTTLCYGNQQCCNFVNLNPSRTNWSEVFYLTYGLYGANHKNTVSAQVIYADYNLSPENPYAEIVYSNWSVLSAKYVESTKGANVYGKSTEGNYYLISKDTAWKILQKDSIDTYIDYSFSYVNDTYYRVDWKWNDHYVRDIMRNCMTQDGNNPELCFKNITLSYIISGDVPAGFEEVQKYLFEEERLRTCENLNSNVHNNCKRNLAENYFSQKNFVISNFSKKFFPGESISTLRQNAVYLKDYYMPKKVVKGNAEFIGTMDTINKDTGSFYIELKDGFWNSNGLRIKLGFNTTLGEFNNGKTEENLTFTGNQNITRYLQLPRYASVTSANLSLTGFEHNLLGEVISVYEALSRSYTALGITVDNNYVWISDNPDGNLNTRFAYYNKTNGSNIGSYRVSQSSYDPGVTWDGNNFYTSERGIPDEIDKWDSSFNYISTCILNADNSLPFDLDDLDSYLYVTDYNDNGIYKHTTSCGYQTFYNLSSTLSSPDGVTWNGNHWWVTTGSIMYKFDSSFNYKGISKSISPYDYIVADGIYFWVSDGSNLNDQFAKIQGDNPSNITNPYLEVGAPNDNREWSYIGKFSTTETTQNLSSSLNTALNNGACDCSGCSISGNNCVIPFLFHSDAVGKLKYSDINIIYNVPPLFAVNTTADSSFTNPTRKGNNATFTANISDYDNDTVTLLICDGGGRNGTNCNGLEYCRDGPEIPSSKSCLYNTLNLTGFRYNWTSFACDNNSLCTNGANGSFYIAYPPKDPKMFVNGTEVWNYSGFFNNSVTVEGFKDEINNSLNSCQPTNSSCNVTLTFFADATDNAGILELSILNIQYNFYDTEPPTIYGIFVKPNPAQRNSIVNISVNATDNVNISLVTAKLEASEKNLTYNETTKLYEGTLTTPSTGGNYNITITVIDSSNISITSSDISTTGTSGSGCTGFCIQSGSGATGKDLTLASKDIVFNLSNPIENDSIRINATIFNFGNTSTSSFNVEFKIDGVSKGTNSLSVSAFGSNSTQFSWNATAGNHTVTVVADSNNAISEDNETNNEASTNIYVQDITPPSILSLITQRGSLILKLNISDNVNITSVSAQVNGTSIQLALNSTSGLWEGYSSAIGAGVYPTIISVIDSSGLTTTAKSTITVYADPIDILLPKGSITSYPSTPSDFENTTIKVNVFNYGINQTSSFVVDLLIDGVLQENKTMSVSGNANSTTAFTWIARYGNHTLTAKIDSNNSVSELNESNNELNTTISVQDAQPPTINKVILPEIVYENAQVMIKVNATDNVNVSKVNATIGSTTINLAYNTTSQLYENSTTIPAAGLNNLTIKVSNPNHLLSSSETLLDIYDTAADLMIDLGGIKISPENITEGNNLTINATIENRGGTDANNFKVELLIDGISQKNSTLSTNKALTLEVSFNWTSTYGNHNVTIRLDRDGTIAESNESNNEYNRTAFVADITLPTAIQNLASSPSAWTNQTSINITWSAATDANKIEKYEYQLDYGSWTNIGNSTNFSLSNQQDGAHIIYLRAIDVPGNVGKSSNVSIYVDKTSPNTPIIKEWHSGINWTQHDTPYLSWTDPGDQGSGITRFAISVDNGADSDLGYVLNYHSAQLSTGSHSFKVKAYDAPNQSSNWSNTINVYIDTALPTSPLALISTTHPNSSKWYKENNVVFNWPIPSDDSGIYGYYYSIDRVNDTVPDSISLWTTNTTINISEVIAPQIAANGSAETNITGLSDGTWYFHIISRDNAGNVGSNVSHYTVKIDTKVPTITNFTPVNKSFTENLTPLFKVDYIDGGSGVNISSVNLTIDGIAANATINETTLTYTPTSNLSKGTHTASITVTDNATNVNTLSWQFTIGNVTLEISNLSLISSQGNVKIFEFIIKNIGNVNASGISWSLNTGIDIINATYSFDLSVNESIFVFNQYNYPRTGDFAVTASATGGASDTSESMTIDVEDVETSNLSILNISGTKVIFEFVIENKLSTNLANVSWVFDTRNSNVINSTIITALQPNEQMYVYVDYNFTATGTFNVNASARNGTLIDYRNLTITI